MANIDPAEVAKFEALASKWWDRDGPFRPLHDLNPVRLQFILDGANIENRACLDMGCGAGILTESLAQFGAKVTGLDAAESLINTAKAHAQTQSLTIDYKFGQLADSFPGFDDSFEVITCMEMLEHVPEPDQMMKDLARALKPGGDLFVSTLNRHPLAFMKAILGAEYILGLLPKGTHEYKQFIKPSELVAWGTQAGLSAVKLKGMAYHPLTRKAYLTDDTTVNYLLHFKKDALK